MQALAASAWVRQGGVALFGVTQCELGSFDLLAGTCAGVGQVLCDQRVQRLLVQRAALRLPHDGPIGVQTALGQLAQDGLVRPGNAARRVHIFNAHQPGAAVRTRIKPTGQGCHKRTSMQRPCGRRRKTTDVADVCDVSPSLFLQECLGCHKRRPMPLPFCRHAGCLQWFANKNSLFA